MIKETNSLSEPRWLRVWTALTAGLILLLLVTAATGVGPLGVYDGFAPPKYVQESRAQDTITLALGVPLLIAALIGAWRRRAWAFPLWMGVLAYELYVYALYALAGIYNMLFLTYIAVASLSLYSIISVLSSVDVAWFGERVSVRMPRRWIGWLFVAIALIFAVIWIGSVQSTMISGEQDSGHLIFVIDLVVVLPAFAITAIKLFRRRPMGDLLAGMLLCKFDSLCLSIALGQLFRSRHNLPVESGLLSAFAVMGLIGCVVTGFYFANLRGEKA